MFTDNIGVIVVCMEIQFHKEREFEKWIGGLGPDDSAKVAHLLDILEEAEQPLGMPQGKDLKDGLWELRASGPRVYYMVNEGTALVLNQGRKDTQQRDIALARKRMP